MGRVKPLLRSNRELRADRIHNFTLPAWVVQRRDGSWVNVCPQAGACAKVCYARNGTFLFPNVRNSHLDNLDLVLDDLPELEDRLRRELLTRTTFRPTMVPRFPDDRHRLVDDPWAVWWMRVGGSAVRIHDSGDFLTDDYLTMWLRIAKDHPHVLFYAYTKEVTRFRRVLPPHPPVNFRWVFSLGGREDHLIDRDRDRHADVFPSLEAITAAGYESQHESDLLAVLLRTNRVGIPQNNIPAFRKRLAGRTFGQAQQERTRR